MVEHLECLIGGSRCGGTYFTAAYLTACGFPCGHERIYAEGSSLKPNLSSDRPNGIPFQSLRGDSSYTVIEWVDLFPKEVPVYLVVRNPLDVLNSCISTDLMHVATVDIDSVAKDIRRRYLRHFDLPNFKGVYRVEDELPKLAEKLGVTPKIEEPPPARNEHNFGRIKLDAYLVCRYQEGKRLIELAQSLGYKV